MKKFYSAITFCLALLLLTTSTRLHSQVTITTALPPNYLYNSATDSGAVVFAISNTNAFPVQITTIGNYIQTGFSDSLSLWYHPTTVTGSPGPITAANGWIHIANELVPNQTTAGIIPIFTGLTLNIPANTTYRFAIQGPPFSPFYAPALSTPNFYTSGGVEVYTHNNPNSPGYGGNYLSPGNTPRGWVGMVSFVPSNACATPVAGSASSSRTWICAGDNFTLDLPNATLGSGQTVQWQSSPDNTNWTNIGTASTATDYTTTHTAGTYYRAIITCGSNSDTSASIYVGFGPLSGTFTINDALPTNGTNFNSFTDAVNSLSCINGPVVFNVAPGSGPYNEQISIPQVTGVSSTNTITFNGNNTTLQYTPSSSLHIIRLSGADYITIKNLTIVSNSGFYGWGVHLLNGADNNTIDSCVIDMSAVTNTDVDSSACIVLTNSFNDINADGNGSNNMFSNNTLIGGYQGVILNGTAGALNASGNIIQNNLIRDFYSTGIELVDMDGAQVNFNDIHRMNRTTVTTFEGVQMGAGNINVRVNGNRIHDTHNSATTQSGAAYGLYSTANDAPVGSENIFTNNLIYNFNSTTGTQYGIYNTGSNGAFYYHNTVVLDHAGSTSGTTKGIYQTTAATGIEVKNNIVVVGRGGTGQKNVLDFATNTSSIVSNNNVLWLTSTTGSLYYGAWGTTDYNSLATWQAANSGAFDQNSVSSDPQFIAPVSGNYLPGNASLATIGANVGVTNDILGIARVVANPTPGAYEIVLTGCTTPPNAGSATSSVNLPVCVGTSVILDVTGNSVGVGQTYQWESGPTSAGPFTPFGSASATSSTTITTTVTTWYRVAVTCSGNTQTSLPVEVVVTQPMPGGTYTINSTQPTGGTNFQTFTDAVNALNCGIAGPIVFDVVAGTGPYTEQVSIPEVTGASSVNTITFNGNGNTLQYNSTSTLKYILQLNGADYIRINRLRIEAMNATYGWGIHLYNGANNNIIDSSTIDVSAVTSTTVDNSGAIAVSGSLTDINADGDASFNIIRNDTLIGGYQTVIINGATGALNATSNEIRNNVIRDFYSVGVELTETDGTIIDGNDISRASRVAVTTFEGVELGAGNRNAIVSNNRIHDTHNSATTQSGAAYGIFSTANDAPVGSENIFYNNLIYNFNSLTGIQYGLYNSGSDGARYYHNTIILDEATSTSGTTKGIYQTTAASNIEVKNNIVVIGRAGTGQKNVLDFATNTSSIVSNNNVLWLTSTAGSNYYGAWGTSDFATFATWQAANGNAFDQNSIEADPQFLSPGTGFFYPNNMALTTVGAPVGVNNDIIGTLRSAVSPTPGAYEILLATGADMGVKSLVSPEQKACFSATETVTVRIVNYSANTHNFATAPVTVNVSVTGPNAQTFAPVVVSTGTLPSGDSLDVVITTTYNMTAAGTYTFNASTTVTGDGNAINNAMPAQAIEVAALDAGTIESNPPSYCVTGGIPTLTLTGNSGGNIQWQESGSASGPWTDVGTGTTTYAPAAAITATMYYRAIVDCGSNADTTAVVSVAVNNPQLLTTVPGTRCGPGSVTLGATGSAGTVFNWYSDATGGTPIGTGASFNTPIINNTTTFYVAASDGGTANVNVGLPNVITGTSGAGTTNFGLVFDVLAPFTLNTVKIYPVSSTANLPGTVTIDVINSTGAVVHTATVNIFGNPGGAVGQVVTLNFNLMPGTNYKIRPGARSTGITGLMFEPSASAPGGNYGYPFVVPGLLSINTSTLTAAPTNTPRNDLYYYFYDWVISTGCESPRQAVVATVTPAPSLDITNDVTVCNNAITPLSVNSTLADFNEYTWTPVNAGLFSDAAATTPITASTNASTVYAQIGTPGTYTIIATANNTTTGCQNYDSLKLTVLPSSITVSPSSEGLCVSGNVTMNITPDPSTFGAATYQWYSSTDNVNYAAISGATASSYNAPTLSTTTFYKVEVMNSAGSVCLSAYDTVIVNAPQILTTTPAALCGPGVMNLSATASPGASINWYTAPVGGSLLHTGSSFTTPNLNNTVTYYVAALQGGSTYTTGVTLSDLANFICGTTTSSTTTNWALRFTTTSSVLINSVYVIPTSAGTVTIQLHNFPSTGQIAQVVSQAFTTGDVGTPQQVNLGFMISTPGDYQLVMAAGGSHRITTMGCGYPMSTPTGAFSITGSAASPTAANSTTTYNSFYEINVTEGCESPRVAVTAQVSGITTITQQPQNISTCVGANISLTVGATGANLNYQWKHNGQNVGSNSATLNLNPITLANAGTYTVEITGLCGNVTSQSVTVNVSADNTWIGQVSSDWNDPANWCGGVPTPTTDVSIFPGTPYQPVINAQLADVRNLTIHPGASVTVMPNGTLNMYGNFVNDGNFVAPNGFVFFKGAAPQTIDAMIVGTAMVNNTGGGITLTGNMTVGQNMVITSGHVTLGINNLTVNGSVAGTLAAHIITNSSGSFVTRNVTTTAVTAPVGHSANSYNPVTISNGGGLDYSVRVAEGLNPQVSNAGLAVNRTWNITPSGNATGVSLTFQYEDGHMNSPGVATNSMEVSAHNGSAWSVVSPAGGIAPSGTPTGRIVTVTSSGFGPMVVGNIGTTSWITSNPNVDPTIGRMVLMPNLVQNSTVLRVISTRAARINYSVIDQSGRVVMTFSKQVMIGQNDIQLEFSKLAAGVYNIAGFTDKGKTEVLRFVKM